MGWADAKDKYTEVEQKPSAWEQAKRTYSTTLSDSGAPGPFGMNLEGAHAGPQLVPTQEAFTDNPADLTTSLGAGFMDDDESRINYFAQARFPDMPDTERRERYGMFKGEVVYVDDEGKLQQEVAGTGNSIARGVGRYGLPVAGGLAGSAAGPIGAATVGAGGEAWRKTIANQLGEEQTIGGNMMAMGKEAVASIVGDGLGRGVTKMANRRVVRDVKNFDREGTARLMDLANEQGIQLTPAEASQLGSLMSQQTRFGMGFDEAGDILKQFYERRTKQEAAAIERFVGDPKTVELVGTQARDVAQGAIQGAKKARKAASDPLYRVADKITAPPEVVDQLMSDPYIASVAKSLKSDPRMGLGDVAEDSVEFFDQIKKKLDSDGRSAVKSGDNFLASRAENTSKLIRDTLDEKIPEYAAARKAFADASPAVTSLEEGIEGLIAKTKDASWTTADVGGMAERVFKGSSPADIRKLKRHYVNAGKSDEWNDFTNVFLRKEWETLKSTQAGGDIGKAGAWRRKIYGDAAGKRRLQAALGEERYSDLENLMEVLDASQSVKKGQSMTEPASQAARAESFEAAPVASLSKGFGVGGIREWWVNSRVDSWRTDIAKVMTNSQSQNTLQQLRRLKQLSPRSEKKIRLVIQALQEAGVNLTSAALAPRPTALPTSPQ